MPGVEFTGLHKDTSAVTQIHFLPGQVSSMSANVKIMAEDQTDVTILCDVGKGRLLSLLDDNTIHLWELEAGAPREVGGEKRDSGVSLRELSSYTLPGRPGIESCRYSRAL